MAGLYLSDPSLGFLRLMDEMEFECQTRSLTIKNKVDVSFREEEVYNDKIFK